MHPPKIVLAMLLAVLAPTVPVSMAQTMPQESDYYALEPLPIPDGVVLEAGALEWLPDGRLAASSRRGEIYLIDNALDDDIRRATFTPFASGLHEVLGLAARNDWLYVTQRCDVSRLRDEDQDGSADLFEVFSDGWEISGDYHEYAFGSNFDKEGNLWVVLCLTGSFSSNVKYRGWCLRITPDGKVLPTCSGIRSPGGIGMNAEGDMFYTDNQGPWNGTCSLKHLRPGSFQGHPGGNRWYEITDSIGPRPADPQSGSRMMTEARKIPQLEPPAVYFPYKKMGQSASGIVCDTSGGKFGPFQNQLFVGDQTFSTVMRVCLEKVQEHYQGACFPFRSGFGSGALSLEQAPDGTLFVGGTNRGWGSRGGKPYSLDRLRWTGKVPFEIHEMHARPDGFELSFTQPVDPDTAGNTDSYKLHSYTYIYQASYGSPEVDETPITVQRAVVSQDGRRVRLHVDRLQEGHVHELHAPGVLSRDGLPLLHDEAYYTLNYLPAIEDQGPGNR
jgi:glucose/arabinose dehydrogenase